jgi:DNA-damage-inducible protein J
LGKGSSFKNSPVLFAKKHTRSYNVATGKQFLTGDFMTDCVVRSRINQQIKIKAAKLFDHMGLTLSDAIRIFLYQSVAEKRIPFSINVPSAATRVALHETLHLKNLEKTSLKQLQEDWGNVCGKSSKPSSLKKTIKKSRRQESTR